jgi:hypothetical protein
MIWIVDMDIGSGESPKVPNKYHERTKPSLIEQNLHIIWRVPLGFLVVFLGYVEPQKLHERLTQWFTKTENFTQSTTEIVVPSSTIDDSPHCTTMYMYLRGESRHFHKKSFFFLKYQKIPRHNSKRKLQNMVKRKMTRTKLEIFC